MNPEVRPRSSTSRSRALRTAWWTAAVLVLLSACEEPFGEGCSPVALGSAPNAAVSQLRELAVAVADAERRIVPRLGTAEMTAPLTEALVRLRSSLSSGDMFAACEAYNGAVAAFQGVAVALPSRAAARAEADVVRLTLGVVEVTVRSTLTR